MKGAKYDGLRRHLLALPFNEWRSSFKEIEAIIGFRLPPSARKFPPWWANDPTHAQANAWLNAGWKTEQVDTGGERVVFRCARNLPSKSVTGQSSALATSAALARPASGDKARAPDSKQPTALIVNRPMPSEIGSSRADVEAADKRLQQPLAQVSAPGKEQAQVLEYRVGFEWRTLGNAILDADGRLFFPTASLLPAVYCFRLRQDGARARYVGETDNLSRRFGHYRNPGPTQQTNLRINARFVKALSAGGEIQVSAVTDAWVDRGHGREVADLSSRAVRRMIENAAILDRSPAGTEILNRESPSTQFLPAPAQSESLTRNLGDVMRERGGG